MANAELRSGKEGHDEAGAPLWRTDRTQRVAKRVARGAPEPAAGERVRPANRESPVDSDDGWADSGEASERPENGEAKTLRDSGEVQSIRAMTA